jgi:hypothetical protein
MTLRGELEKTFDIYETSTGGGCSSDPAVPDAAWLEDLAAQDRIMFGTLADEFVRIPPGWDHAFRAQAAWECVTGPVQPASVNRACELAKYPLVISTVPVDAYRCSDGVYLYRRADPTSYVWAALARALGFNDNGVLPSPRNVDLSAISLASLQEGAAIFREGTGMTCQDHCPGFVSGTEPETNGPEEAFSWALWYYAVSGQAFRADAVQGLASHPCNDLMARKYDWLKANIFHGNENFRFIAGPAETLGRCN